MYEDESKQFFGDSNGRINSMFKMSGSKQSNGLFKVNMPKYQKSLNLDRLASKLPKPATLISVAVVAGICLGGYKLYTKFFTPESKQDKDDDAGTAALAKTYVSTDQAKANEIQSVKQQTSQAGYQVSPLHQGIANQLHDWMNSVWVDHDEIIKSIKGESTTTFQLVSVAYGTRTLPSYSKWHLTTLSQNEAISLKDSLNYVLSSSELTSIHDYISAI